MLQTCVSNPIKNPGLLNCATDALTFSTLLRGFYWIKQAEHKMRSMDSNTKLDQVEKIPNL